MAIPFIVQDKKSPVIGTITPPQEDEVTSLVYKTTDYDKFQLESRNRIVAYERVIALVEAIKKKNLLPDQPMDVDASMTILDGQTRFAAAKMLKLPIYYKYVQVTKIEDISEETAVRHPWSPRDRLHFYVVSGYPEYISLQSFVDRYPFINVNNAVKMCRNTEMGNLIDDYNQGRYLCNNLDHAEKVARMALDFKRWFDFWKQRAFLSALRNLVRDPSYNHERMMHKLEFLSTKIVHCVDTADYLKLFTLVYNYSNKTAEPVTFVQSKKRKKK